MGRNSLATVVIVLGSLPASAAEPQALRLPVTRDAWLSLLKAPDKMVRTMAMDKLADQDGKLRPGMSPDRLHLSAQGYQVWADALKPILTEILGPQAKDDLAPPPTGDPSAAGRRGGKPGQR